MEKNQSNNNKMNPEINNKIVQNVLLIWLDNNIEEDNSYCLNTITQLRRAAHCVTTFADVDKCTKFIKSVTDEKICIVTSGSLGQRIIPNIHNIFQIDSIFIFCGDESKHKEWAKNWPKVKGIFTEIAPICEAAKLANKTCERNAMPFSVIPLVNNRISQNTDDIQARFIFAQILKEIILNTNFGEQHIKQFIEYCRVIFANNIEELSNVQGFERKYAMKKPIWTYTCDSFLSAMVCRALRLMDVEIIIKLGFFIADLHRQIDQLHKDQISSNQINKTLKLFHGQGIAQSSLHQITQGKGGLISFTSFLSVFQDREISLRSVRTSLTNPDLVGVLFVLTVNPSESGVPFASILNVGANPGEDKFLFSMHSVFRIESITAIDESNRLFQIDLTLLDENNQDFRMLSERIRNENFPDESGWFRFGSMLLKMNLAHKAQEVYQMLLNGAISDSEKAPIYNQLGWVEYSQQQYKQSIEFYEKSLEIYKKILSSTDPDLAHSYNNISLVYFSMGEYSKALQFYETALEIRKNLLPSNHPDLIISYNNVAGVYYEMGNYPNALTHYQKALENRIAILPSTHIDIAYSYTNIGLVYFRMGELSQALSYYEKALEIRKQNFPPTHPDLIAAINDITTVSNTIKESLKKHS